METNGDKTETEVKTEPQSEEFQKLTEYGINTKVATEIVKIYETGIMQFLLLFYVAVPETSER